MGATAIILEPAEPATAPDLAEARETAGVTTRLILDYVEREAGPDGVRQLLRTTGLVGREEELRDDNHWSSYRVKIALLEAAAEVLGDPLAARHIGAAIIDINVAPALKLSLRTLGNLRLLYKNIPGTCSKFTATHRMQALEVGTNHARIAYTDVSGTGYHPADCDLNIGLLSSAPMLFGLPLARVSHPICARDGGDTCVYEVRWQTGVSRRRNVLGAVAAASAVGGSLLFDPSLLPAAGTAAMALGAAAAFSELRFRRRRIQHLEQHAEEQAEVSEQMVASLQDLVSALRLDEVLAKIRKNAEVAVPGKEFALLVGLGEGTRCHSSSTLPARSAAALEEWAAGDPGRSQVPTVLEDLSQVPVLASLPRERSLPLRSLCTTPLVYRGRALGVLVALANSEAGFLPHDFEVLHSYAAQAAIAFENARLYETQQQLASRDPLTGLLNHREFHEAVARELDGCRRHGGSMAVVLLDLDDFKNVNDTSGHAVGDRVLLAAADGLRATCRASDQAFRIGGDEFALILPQGSGRTAMPAAERALEAMAASDSRVRVSYGIAEWPADGQAKASLLRRADERLYEMKRSGAGQDENTGVAPPMGESQRERLACVSRLSARLAPLLDPGQIASEAVAELDESLHFRLAVVHRLDPDRVLRASAGAGALAREMNDLESWSQRLDHGVVGRVARTGEPALVHDTDRDPHFVGADGLTPSGSELAVAIRAGGEVWGVLNLEQGSKHAFDADDVVFADLVAAHVGAALDRTRLAGELECTLITTLTALSDALEHKDAYTAQHAREVERLVERVGVRLGLGGEELRTVGYAALLHDIGKIAIPTEILNKADRLTEDEFEQIKQHTVIGARMLEKVPFFELVHPLIRSAHERWDGRGYPDALAASEIPLGSRIICACDAFHAMTSDRPYRAAMSVADAVAELRLYSGRQFDPAVVDAVLADAMADLARA